MTSTPARKVLVAGATSAIAQAAARVWAARGDALYLVARDADRMDAVRSDLLARGASRVEMRTADFDDVGELPVLANEAWAAMGGFDVALVAYGVLLDSQVCRDDPLEAARQVHTNLVSPAALLAALAMRFEAQGSGTIAVIGSVAGDRGRQSNYVYGASKGGLEVYADGLRHRLAARGVNVLVVKPGFVDTPMTRDFPKGPLWASPAKVGADIVRAVDKRKGTIYTPWFWYGIMAIVRNVPRGVLHRTRL